MKSQLSTLLLVSAIICLTLAWAVDRNNRFYEDISVVEGTGIWHEAMMLDNLSIYEPPEISLNIDRKRVWMVRRLFLSQMELASFTRFADDYELLKRQGYPFPTSPMNEKYTPEKMTATMLNCLDCKTVDDYFDILSTMELDEVFTELCNGGASHHEFRSFLQRSIRHLK